ncbi:SAV_2336 N-terminal domain-related protein [Streptomyces echinatus]|uniref:Tetratricopeptide (TPR) repeat protein n=1 Tax=Streptomyces echinatus TaxID=67293 RepID=A0A7W9PWJ8_9ACTN|nr:SAV_2336 N-terminal domain-related protein [Streptomyces echinatus]MBB5929290.1 tetratricopeptide (TPR) repeat protein [Streptomyces echinatus]
MPGMRLDELIGKLRQGGLQPTAEDVADALWLARRLGTAPARDTPGTGTPAAAPDGAPGPPPESAPDGEPGPRPGSAPPGASPAAAPGAPTTAPADAPAPAVPLHTPAPAPGGRSPGDTPAAFPVRAPAAGALPGLLGLQKALRALGRYRPASLRGQDERIDEAATADRAAASGILLPVTRPGRRRRCDVQLLMDTGPAMAVWGEMVEELRQACQQSGAFASVRVHHLYADGSGTPLVGTTAGPGRRTRLRPADELHDPSGRRLTFVISDCVGPLWQNGTVQRLLQGWPRTAPLAVVQPLPPRLWGRTALPAEPGMLVRTGETGGRLDFLPEDEPWEEVPPGTRPVPVLQPTPEAFEAFARLLGGTGPTREHAWAGFAHTGTAPGEPAGFPPPRGDDDLLRAFRAGASPGALRLAVYLAAAPLTLPVMQLVQRAMLPDTGPMELAEVLLGGLLRQLPGTEDQPCFAYSPRMQDLLLSSLDQDTAGLVLKHCSAYVERHFGKGTRNFAALAAARLADHDPAAGAGRLAEDGGPRDGGSVEAELFARIPARVLRFYLPDLVTPDPLTEAERLLDRWRQLADPEMLRRARDRARAATDGTGGVPDAGLAARARLVLGRVLRAEAGTAGARTEGRRAGLLREAVAELAAAYATAPADSRERAEAALELASCRREVWRLTAEPDQLTQALRVLDAGTPPWPRITAVARARPGATAADGDGHEDTDPEPAAPREPPGEGAAPRAGVSGEPTGEGTDMVAAPYGGVRREPPADGTGEGAAPRAGVSGEPPGVETDVVAASYGGVRREPPADGTGEGAAPRAGVSGESAGGGAVSRGGVPWEVGAHRDRLLLRGRILLDLRHPGAAVPELREACALLARQRASDAVRGPALLDLARALRGAGAEDSETRHALHEARRAAGDDPALLLPSLTALAAFHDTAGEPAEADAAYERAALLAPADGPLRVQLLTAWGESLLRRASTGDGAGVVDRAEHVLREALKSLPARSAHRGRLQGLVGSALAQRFRHLGFLPDLFESRHLLGQAVRAATDAAVRAEVWLQLGRVRLEGWYHAGAPVLMEALQAYENAEREAAAAHGGDPGSVTAARARHGCGTVLALMGRPGAAAGAFRAAREQWQRLVGALRQVDWADVELTRRAEREAPPEDARSLPERAWRETAPPWWPWSQDWADAGELDRS